MIATIAEIMWRPVFLPLHICGLAGILAVLAIAAYARTFSRSRLMSLGLLAMRLTAVAALTVLLMGPSRLPPQHSRQRKGKLVVLLDTSRSMRTEDCSGASRIEFAGRSWLSDSTLEQLRRTHDVQLSGFDSQLRAISAEALASGPLELARGRQSHIAGSVAEALQKLSESSGQAAILVVSDGHDSARAPTEPVALLARARGVAVHTVCLGGPTSLRDILVAALPEQQYMLDGEGGNIIVKVRQVHLPKAETILHVRCGAEHVTRKIAFNGQDLVTVKIPVKQDQPGLYEYKVSVDAVAGEAETGNNGLSVFMEVTAQRIRVLVLEGEPFWTTKFIAQSLRKDSRIELTQLTQLSQAKREGIVTRSPGTNPKIPSTAAEWARYDVVVIGGALERLMDSGGVKLLVDFVSEQGGHVVFARGRPYDSETPAGRKVGRDIAVLEPVVWGRGFRHNLSLWVTPAGRANPCFSFGDLGTDVGAVVAQLPGFTVMPAVARGKAATVELARAVAPGAAVSAAAPAGSPAVVSMHCGRGQVVAILGEGLWQWGLLPAELARFDGVYDKFWSNIIRWLTIGSDFLPGRGVSLRLGGSSVRLGDDALVDLSYRQAPPRGQAATVAIIAPDGARDDVPLESVVGTDTRLRGTYTPKTPGVYKVVAQCAGFVPATLEKRFSVYDVDLESLQASAESEPLRTLAEQSGGVFFEADQAHTMPRRLAGLRVASVATPRPLFVWDRAIIMLVLLAWMGAEYIMRKKGGLL